MKRSFVIVILICSIFLINCISVAGAPPSGGDCNPAIEICFDDGDDPGDLPDNVAPVISVDTSPIYMNAGDVLDLPQCLAYDDYDPNVSCEMETDFDILKTGEYYLRYSATDESGNVSEIKTVDVIVTKDYPMGLYPNTDIFMEGYEFIYDYSIRAFENNKLKARINSDEESLYYEFLVTEENLEGMQYGTIDIQLDEIPYGENVDLYVYDHDAELIYQSTNSLNYDEEVTFTVYPGVYFFEVRKVNVGSANFRMDINGLTNFIEISAGVNLSTTGLEIYTAEFTSQVVDIYKYYIPASLLKVNHDKLQDIINEASFDQYYGTDYFGLIAAGGSIIGGTFAYLTAEYAAATTLLAVGTYVAGTTTLIGAVAGLLYIGQYIDNQAILDIINTVQDGNVNDYIVITVTHIDGDRHHNYFNSYGISVIEDFSYTTSSIDNLYEVHGIDVDHIYFSAMIDKINN